MNKTHILSLILLTSTAFAADIPKNYTPITTRLIQTATNSAFGFKRLETLCDTFGPRFTGTKNLEDAIDWCMTQMKKDGFKNVHGEKVKVPRWVRGKESATLLSPRQRALPMMGLGGSIGTPQGGIIAEVLVVASFDALKNGQPKRRERWCFLTCRSPVTARR